MEKVENGIIRVYLADGYWNTGVLFPYFENPTDEQKPMFFRSDNCDFDVVSRCYVFRLPQLDNAGVLRDVYIPERFVVGVAVKHGSEPEEPKKEMRRIGFAVQS